MPFKPPYTKKEELESKLKQSHLFSSPIQTAIQYAEEAHRYQKRDNGNSYLEEHIYPLAWGLVDRYKNDADVEKLLILGFLHDVLEDGPNASASDMERDFRKEMLGYVKLLTKNLEDNADTLSADEVKKVNKKILQGLEHASRLPQIIKLEDRLSNISCIEKANNSKYRRYLEETRDTYVPFAERTHPLYKKLLLREVERIT